MVSTKRFTYQEIYRRGQWRRWREPCFLFKLAATSESMAAQSGLILFGECIRGAGFHRWLDLEMPRPGSGHTYTAVQHVLPMVGHLAVAETVHSMEVTHKTFGRRPPALSRRRQQLGRKHCRCADLVPPAGRALRSGGWLAAAAYRHGAIERLRRRRSAPAPRICVCMTPATGRETTQLPKLRQAKTHPMGKIIPATHRATLMESNLRHQS